MSPETFLNGRVQLFCGDSWDVLKTIPDCSIDSIVTDPPYGLQFMGREWDKLWRNETEADAFYIDRLQGQLTSRARKLPDYSNMARGPQMQEFHFEWAKEALRVLKPGGHVVAFSGTRTYHRMACAIEDAGFEVRDMLSWLYGSGFPKSHDVSKGMDKDAGAEREFVAARKGVTKTFNIGATETVKARDPITAPSTDAAIEWQGWGTALKPACEPICFARKPLVGTVAANVLEHGTGAINIDGCRVDATDGLSSGGTNQHEGTGWGFGAVRSVPHVLGRWPANVIHDGSEEVIAAFPESAGQQGDIRGTEPSVPAKGDVVYGFRERVEFGARNDSGSAARFFYSAKADADDRLGSKHPTIKPIDLIQWLCRLVTPKGGTILDPFAGTGTTGEAAFREGFNAILIEREEEYQADIRRRMALAMSGPEERRRESVKAGGNEIPFGPDTLFGGATP